MEDSYRHKGLRNKLVEEIRGKGISDERILQAMNVVPRHFFMDSSFISFSYRDKAFPIGAGQTISQPYTVAVQTQLLDVQRHMKVLEIGTGSGYQTAVLLELGANVYTIERQRELFLKAQLFLPGIGYHPHFYYGDGYEGLPAFAPFNRILITAAVHEIPQKLLDQLKIGGRIVAPVGDSGFQTMTRVDKQGEHDYHTKTYGSFVFVPMLPGKSL